MKRWVLICLGILFGGVFGFAGYHVISTVMDARESEALYSGMAGSYVTVNPASGSGQGSGTQNVGGQGSGDGSGQAGGETPADGSEPSAEPLPIPPISVNFPEFLADAPQGVGWIYCEGTCVDYPVAQGEDNVFLLRHLLDGTYNTHGTIFVDCGNRPGFVDLSNIIYGHHMDDGTMFAVIEEYKSQEFYEEHPVMWLLTPEQNYMVELFAGYVTDAYSEDAYRIFTEPGPEYTEYLASRIAQSDFKARVTPGETDRTVMLSTCDYTVNNARYVLHGVLRDAQ